MFYNIYPWVMERHHEEVRSLSPWLRQAQLFRYFTEEMPLEIRATDRFAGWYGYETEPEAPEPVPGFPFYAVLTEEERALRQGLAALNTEVNFTPAHTCLDYGTIVSRGLIHYVEQVECALTEEPENDRLQAMKLSFDAVVGVAERYAVLAEEQAQKAEGSDQERLLRMAAALRRVPLQPAEDFLQAVQSVWLMHMLIPVAEQCWSSISIGRIDQYLYPYYKKALAEGQTEEELQAILRQLFLLLDSYGDGACAMNIGGMDAAGNDCMNGLSELLIRTEKEMALRAPIFAVRVTPKTPAHILDSLIDFDLFKIGQPTFYGEMPCRQAMVERGVPAADAVDFSANSCMGLVLAGREFADMWGIKFNMHLPLELAVNGGKPFVGTLPVALKTPPCEITDFESLVVQYERYVQELLGIYAALYRKVAQETAENRPDPLLSALTEGCIHRRCDRSVGAEYNAITVETIGLVNTIDALCALREQVFEKGAYSLLQVVEAAKTNFEGNEALRRALVSAPKYGENRQEVNALCRRLGETIAQAGRDCRFENFYYLPSLHTIDCNVGFGSAQGATLDGRPAGEPVNKNANPSHLLRHTAHTDHILSAASLPQTGFSGGQPIDLYFEKAWFADKALRNKIKALILTYFEQGGLQFQVNSVDIALLEAAHREPEKYPHVIVRVGGFSLWFRDISPAAREDMIVRAKQGEIV